MEWNSDCLVNWCTSGIYVLMPPYTQDIIDEGNPPHLHIFNKIVFADIEVPEFICFLCVQASLTSIQVFVKQDFTNNGG